MQGAVRTQRPFSIEVLAIQHAAHQSQKKWRPYTCASGREVRIESVCIPYMGVSAQMVAKGGGEDQE